jgi:hypothetical protein
MGRESSGAIYIVTQGPRYVDLLRTPSNERLGEDAT